MIESKDTIPAERDGKYRFDIHYSGREVPCVVEKEQKMLHVTIDDNIKAEYKINNDGSISHVEGATLADSSVDYIRKKVLQ